MNPVPQGLPAKHAVRSHPHDFGTCREVSVRYSGEEAAACDFAFQVESSAPDGWDWVAQQDFADLQRLPADARGDARQAPVQA